jgi:hypothetical protein
MMEFKGQVLFSGMDTTLVRGTEKLKSIWDSNTFRMFELLGFQSSKVDMMISFGKDGGKDGDWWSNVMPSNLIDR